MQYIHGSKKYFELLEDIRITLSNGDDIVIEKGFVWDLSSVPKFLWWLFPPFGDFNLAALIHDWIQITDYKRVEMGDRKNKAFGDREMLKWSKKLNDFSLWAKADNYIRYFGVVVFGWRLFKRWRIDTLKTKNNG